MVKEFLVRKLIVFRDHSHSFAGNLLFLFIFSTSAFAQTLPQTLVLEGELLARNFAESKLKPNPAIVEVVKDAEKIVKKGKVYSVTSKKQIPPSGDKNDYLSQSPYWWADPTKPNGLPYVRRDGERNPEINRITDNAEMGKLKSDAELCAVAYFLSGREKFAEHSAKLIRVWFIDPKTKMNPNLSFGQGIPGIATGRGVGLIETRDLHRVIDASILLGPSKFWTSSEHILLKQWFADFAKWMIESDLGKEEAKAKNNHGTYYDAQLISYLVFTDQSDLAKKQVEVSKQRLKNQMEKDGALPHELARTLSWDYSFMNLFGFYTIARLAEKLKVDFWNFETDGKGIRKSLEWHKPFIKGERKWTHQQIKPPKMDNAFRVFSIAARKYKIHEYKDLTDKIKEETKLTPLELITR